jgi:putative transcriptional regulator
MMRHVDDLLPEYALGTLARAERDTVDRHVGGCPTCAAELRATNETWATVALAIKPSSPPGSLRSRVLESIAGGASSGRFAQFVDQVRKMIDASRETVCSLLDSIDELTAWEAGPSESSKLMHLPAGPALAGQLVGFVRVEPGTEFPLHKHLGEETVLILQGALEDCDGTVSRRGDVVNKAAGTEHSFRAIGKLPLIYLVVLDKGVEFPGLPGFEV